MVSLTNIASVSTAVSDALKLSTKPTDLYDPKNPSAEAAAKYTLSSMSDAVNTAEKYYNPNVDKEIAAIVKLSKEAQLNNIPETTHLDDNYVRGAFLVTHKAGAGRPSEEQNTLYDPWDVYTGHGTGIDVISAVRSPVSQHINFMTDNLTSFERIRAESQYGTVNKNFSLKQFRVSETIANSDKRYFYLIQHSGLFRANLTPNSDEASVGSKIALELRSDFNIYYTYDDKNYIQKTVTTKYRVGVDDQNEIKYGGLTEQITLKNYTDNGNDNKSFSQLAYTRQTSAYIGENYNRIDTTVSSDTINYVGVSDKDNSPEIVNFSSQREKDSVSQLNLPGTNDVSTTYHLSTSKLVQLEKNVNVPAAILAVKVIGSSERLISASNSDNGVRAASDTSFSSRISFNDSANSKTLYAQTGKDTAVLHYNSAMENGYYTIGGGGISVYSGLAQPTRSSLLSSTPYVSKSFKKIDIPTIYTKFGDARVNGNSLYSVSLNINSSNTSVYSNSYGINSNISVGPSGSNIQSHTLMRGTVKTIFVNVQGGFNRQGVVTGPYGASVPNMGSQGVFFLTSFSPGSSGNPNDFYGLSTNNGRGPFHIINNKLYSYKQGTTNPNKYFRITV